MSPIDPTPMQASRQARRSIPRDRFRGVPVYDLGDIARVMADCETYDPHTCRLWAPRYPTCSR